MKYKYIMFDFDGTVVNSVPCIVKAVKDTFAHYDFPEPDEEEIKRYIGIPIETYFPYLSKEHYERHDPKEVLAHFRKLYKEYSPTEVVVFDGMKKLLQDLKNSERKLGVVSSKTSEAIHHNCTHMNIALFDSVVGSDNVRLYKPLPETVFRCAQEVGVEDMAEVIVIGDSPKDIEMGVRAGCDTCSVPWGAGTETELAEAKATYTAKDMAHLREILMQG